MADRTIARSHHGTSCASDASSHRQALGLRKIALKYAIGALTASRVAPGHGARACAGESTCFQGLIAWLQLLGLGCRGVDKAMQLSLLPLHAAGRDEPA